MTISSWRACRRLPLLRKGLAFLALIQVSLVATAEPSSAQRGAAESRVALVIGNRSYPDIRVPLAHPVNDSRALADELRQRGFSVEFVSDVNRDAMIRAIEAFKQRITPGSVALFSFAGYAIQLERQNLLIPTNVQIWSEGDLRREGIPLESVLSDMHARRPSAKIIVIDAARRNPYERRFRTNWDGLAPLEVPERTLAILSALPGKTLLDGGGDHSLFMTELLNQMRTPDTSAEDVFRMTRINVSRASNGERIPRDISTLVDEFMFAGSGPAPRAPSLPPPPPSASASSPAPPTAAAKDSRSPDRSTVLFPTDLKPGTNFRDCDECPELIVLPAGEFRMGSNEADFEKPEHRVTIRKPIAIGRHEVRFVEWDACVAAGGCKHRPDDLGKGRGERPVTNVSWDDVKAYLGWLSQKTGEKYRLPSEAEWEYAARAGTTTRYWWGQEAGRDNANCRDCGSMSVRQMVPTGSFAPNKFGLYDTAGNAAEWVEDCWNENFRGAPSDGSAWTGGQCRQRVLRGGSLESVARHVRSAARFRYDADVRYYGNGFRVVRELQ